MIDLSRSPAWRADRVHTLLLSKKDPSRTYDDEWVHRLFRFLRRYNRVSEMEHARLQSDYPDINAALIMSQETIGPKWTIEAGIMARLTGEELAEKLHCDTGPIRAYEKLYFDVREGLDSWDWVHTRVLYPAIMRKLSERDFDFLWKLLAYSEGWDVLCDYMYFRQLTDDRTDLFENHIKSRIIKNTLKATYITDVNRFSSNDIVQQYLLMKKIEKEEGPEAVKDAMSKGMIRVFDSMAVTVMRQDGVYAADEPRALTLLERAQLPAPAAIKEGN